MTEKLNADKEQRRKKRHLKKKGRNVFAILLLLIIGTVGIVNAQSMGYEIHYKGQNIGSVQSQNIFNAGLQSFEKELQNHYGNEGITIKDAFELVPERIENPMNLEECIAALKGENIEISVKGAEIYVKNKSVGVMSSVSEAQNVLALREKILPEIAEIYFDEKVVPLSETKDFSSMIESIQNAVKK